MRKVKKELKGGKESDMVPEILIQGYKCERCGHIWVPRKNEYGVIERPRTCPRCKSAWWDKPKPSENENDKKE